MSDVRLRLPLWFRLISVGFGLVWCGLLLVFIIAGFVSLEPAWLLLSMFAASMFVLGVFVFGSVLWVGVDAVGESLKVRNVFRTSTFERDQIAEVRIGPDALPLATAVVVIPHEGPNTPISVTTRRAYHFGAKRQARQLFELQAWLRSETWADASDHTDAPRWSDSST